MGLFDRLKKKSRTETLPTSISERSINNRMTLQDFSCLFTGTSCGSNFIELYKNIPEISFPINFIAARVASGKFQLKKLSDDSVVFNNKEINQFFYRPNPMQSFEQFISMHVLYKKLTGNSYIKAAMNGSIDTKEVWKWCSTYWVLPAPHVQPEIPYYVPLYSNRPINEMITGYKLSISADNEVINPKLILHSRETSLLDNPILGESRLLSQRKPISNLIAVYEARNIIYTKRGALGMFVSKKQDETGTVPLTAPESDSIRKEYEKTHGITGDKSPVGVIGVASDFIKMNMSIAELEPFKESLVDACSIAGAFEIPSDLVPREDHSTYSNQEGAESTAYTRCIIPEANLIAKELTYFLGLENSGMYIDVDYSDVDCLKAGRKKEEESKRITSDRAKIEFESGIITLNDWRARIGESKVNNPLYDKLYLEMSDAEVDKINKLIKNERPSPIKL